MHLIYKNIHFKSIIYKSIHFKSVHFMYQCIKAFCVISCLYLYFKLARCFPKLFLYYILNRHGANLSC